MIKLNVTIKAGALAEGELNFTYLITSELELRAIRNFLKELNKYNQACTVLANVRN